MRPSRHSFREVLYGPNVEETARVVHLLLRDVDPEETGFVPRKTMLDALLARETVSCVTSLCVL